MLKVNIINKNNNKKESEVLNSYDYSLVQNVQYSHCIYHKEAQSEHSFGGGRVGILMMHQ